MNKVVNIRKEKYDVYIGRAGKGQDGRFGNPVIIGKICPECNKIHTSGRATLPCYKKYLWRKLNSDTDFKAQVKALNGKTLGCFCKPKPCHGDVLAKAIEWLNQAIIV